MLKELHPDVIDNTLTDDLEEDAINVSNHECQENNCQKQQRQPLDTGNVDGTQPGMLLRRETLQRRCIHDVRSRREDRLRSAENKGLGSIDISVEAVKAKLPRLVRCHDIERHIRGLY